MTTEELIGLKDECLGDAIDEMMERYEKGEIVLNAEDFDGQPELSRHLWFFRFSFGRLATHCSTACCGSSGERTP